jgi:Bax protein
MGLSVDLLRLRRGHRGPQSYAMTEPANPPNPISRQRFSAADVLVLLACLGFFAAFSLLEVSVRYPPPPDFANLPLDEKKAQFFAYLSPIISDVNFQLAAARDRVAELRATNARGESIGWIDRRWLHRLAIKLEVDIDSMGLPEALETLHRRAGVVPESIVLVQAAVESGWGTSRFAIEGNNFFGQRCYRLDCGIVPEERPDDERFGLANFASPAESVESYILNLNTHDSYREFRDLRNKLRLNDQPITGLALVNGLRNYSERGEEYVNQIASMIRSNNLE